MFVWIKSKVKNKFGIINLDYSKSKTMENNTFFKTPILGFLFIVFCCLMQFACNKQQEAKQMSAEAYNYIYAHTSGTISKADPIRVRFTKPVVADSLLNTLVSSNLLSFNPSIKGESRWENSQTLLFEPTGKWASGANYIAKLKLATLFDDVPKSSSNIEFDFKIIELVYDVDIKGLSAINKSDLSKQELEGVVNVSDVVESENIEKIISAKQGNRDLPIRWNFNSSKNKHTFYVTDIRREQTQDGEITINWNGSSIDVETKGSQTYSVPALNNFKVMKTDIFQGAEQYLSVHFSDPLLQNQEVKGLIQLGSLSDDDLRFDIENNILKIYSTTRLVGDYKLIVREGLKNSNGMKMRDLSEWNLTFMDVKPAVRLVGQGVVMPNSDGLIFPFEAVSLNAIDVEIFKIFDNNILHFLQSNNLQGSNNLERVGRIIFQKKIELKDIDPKAQFYNWRRYAINLADLIETDPNAIYQVRIGFKPNYSTYVCDKNKNNSENENVEDDYYEGDYFGDEYYDETLAFDREEEYTSIWGGYYGVAGYYRGFNWKHRQNPCYPAYYNYENFVRSNVIASNLGLIAKGGDDGSVMVAVSDIKTTQPVSGTNLLFYDYQNQLIKSIKTDSEGMAEVQLNRKPFVVVAEKGLQKGYLKMGDGNALSLSKFDVAGARSQKGLKGYIYAERGVWRPGDSIYLNFILEDENRQLPSNYPVSLEMYDPRGQLQYKTTSSDNINGLYGFTTQTNVDDPTGNWSVNIKAGGASFNKTLKIETVKPNRLKIKLDFGEGDLMTDANGKINGQLESKWLHGAPAKGLKAKVEVQLGDKNTRFENYKNYVFDDPTRSYRNQNAKVIFDEELNENGQATINTDVSSTYAGKMRANFKVRVFEKGGDASINTFSKTYSPYSAYAGINIPQDKYGQRRLKVKESTPIDLVVVDAEGKPLSGKAVSVGLYKTNWRWWWDRSSDNVSRYNSNNHIGSLQKESLVTQNNGKTKWNVKVDTWGRYLVRVCDEETGHCAGAYFYAGNPWSDGEVNREQASILAFSADKEKYNVGETVQLKIPTGEAGRALISIESGSKVIETYWMDAKKGENTFSFYVTPEMTPTVYANVSLIQPHAQVKNDLPIRMYGVIPINVEDKETKLYPKIQMPDVLKPEQKVQIKVSEDNGKAMAYTIAMVDDGLLDLTNFKTPDPWNTFYAREALGVKTWDLYDQVLGAFGGELESALSIGGDGEEVQSPEGKKANRFEPVVRHLGPFYLESGSTATHEIVMPNYVGSVRTMIVAANKGAYGNMEKTTAVRKPLMILATLPRVIGPGESLALPVNVFAMEDKVKNVEITVEEISGLVDFDGTNQQSIQFSKPDDQIVDFALNVGEQVGIATFKITAKGGGEVASQEIEIDVRNPNPYITNVERSVVKGGEDWTTNFEPVGMKGTNTGILEVSNLPPIDLGKRLDYLLRYPYGCLEQTTSKGFPLLYLDRLVELTDQQKTEVPKIIDATIERLRRFQQSDGSLSYWPTSRRYYNGWAGNYAGHFLVEAKKLGYTVPDLFFDRYIKFQKKYARKWDPETNAMGMYRHNSDLEQAYRLYILAAAQQPEYGAMNRLREMPKLSNSCKWRLAAAYAVSGKPEVAQQIIDDLSKEVDNYTELSYTFGSSLRDRAMIIETLVILNDQAGAMELVEVISDQISSNRWWNTQALAFSFVAIGKLIGDKSLQKGFNFSYQIGNEPIVNAGSENPYMQIEVPIDGTNNRKVSVTNPNNNVLFARLITTGQPLVGDQNSTSSHLEISVQYKDMNGGLIDPQQIAQGTDFIAEVNVTNPGSKGKDYKEMALTQIFPSGWEIINSRMDNLSNNEVNDNANQYTYQDIKDDRVNTFFNVRQNKQQTYRIQLNAAYEGRFYLPTTACQAMYDNTISASKAGKWVEVVMPGAL